MPIITCPHCAASGNMPIEKLPAKATNARCPKCYQSFPFDPAQFPSVPAQLPAKSCNVTCPHCELPRQIPDHRPTDPQASLRCRRCQGQFRIAAGKAVAAEREVSTPQQLKGIGTLLTESWEALCRRGWNLLALYLLGALLLLTPLLVATFALPDLIADDRLLLRTSLLAAVVYAGAILIWLTASLFQQVVKPQLTLRQALRQGWQSFGQFAWLLLLLSLLIGGGALLLLPGILFSIWFFFSQYILAETGIGGLAALQKSHHLVRGRFWAVVARIALLLPVSVAISSLASRLPMIGSSVNFILTLLLVPFSLLFCQLVYEDLKRCQPRDNVLPEPGHRWLYPTLATLGWMVIPGLLLFASQQNLHYSLFAQGPAQFLSDLSFASQQSLQELTEEQSGRPLSGISADLSVADYDRLLKRLQLMTIQPDTVNLGPASLEQGLFKDDAKAAQLLLKLKIAPLPNLDLSARRTARILIDRIDDSRGEDLYNRNHSFESAAFQWVDILSAQRQDDQYSGTRSVYLKQGTRPEQVHSISGSLELNLPLGIESIELTHDDIGKPFQLAGRQLILKELDGNQISLNVGGKRSDLLGLQAVDAEQENLRGMGESWLTQDQQLEFQQRFNGRIDKVTIRVASDSVVRSYPFEIIP